MEQTSASLILFQMVFDSLGFNTRLDMINYALKAKTYAGRSCLELQFPEPDFSSF
jgi:hypothetical protein